MSQTLEPRRLDPNTRPPFGRVSKTLKPGLATRPCRLGGFFSTLLADVNLKSRMTELKAIRDTVRADADRVDAKDADKVIRVTPDILRRFAGEVKRRLRKDDGTFRRHRVQALAQRVEVGRYNIRITESSVKLLRTLAGAGLASPGVFKTATEVRSFEPKWLRR